MAKNFPPLDQIYDFSADLQAVDILVRKSIKKPDGIDNVPEVIAALSGLAANASRAAQALSSILSHDRSQELLEARLRAASAQQVSQGE